MPDRAKRPRIAMTTWRRTMPTFLDDRTDLYTLGAEYPAAIHAAGGLAVLLPHHAPADAQQVLDGFDGLVLVGGDDIDPARYGDENTGLSKGASDSADDSDLAFAKAAADLAMPLFAICRGCQALNVAMGGTLHQDITRLAGLGGLGGRADPDGLHRRISERPADVLAERHPIEIDASSRLARAYGGSVRRPARPPARRMVNTIHHQAIDIVAPGFRAVAWADDGVIEAIEPDDQALPILAVQWHPEKIVDEGDDLLFEYFVQELVR